MVRGHRNIKNYIKGGSIRFAHLNKDNKTKQQQNSQTYTLTYYFYLL